MNKIQRVDRVLKGEGVDYPPISLWYHFGLQHAGGEQFARISLEYFHHYDFDFFKVMNDYYYPTPKGLDTVRTREDLLKFAAFDVERCEWREQFKALRIIGSELKGRAHFIDTVFDPWQSIRRKSPARTWKSRQKRTRSPACRVGGGDPKPHRVCPEGA